MKGWRSKLIFIFIVYFSGFATAIYMLAPKPENENNPNIEKCSLQSVFPNFDSEEFVQSFNSGMHKCVDLGKDAALKTSQYIKEQIQEKQTNTQS